MRAAALRAWCFACDAQRARVIRRGERLFARPQPPYDTDVINNKNNREGEYGGHHIFLMMLLYDDIDAAIRRRQTPRFYSFFSCFTFVYAHAV